MHMFLFAKNIFYLAKRNVIAWHVRLRPATWLPTSAVWQVAVRFPFCVALGCCLPLLNCSILQGTRRNTTSFHWPLQSSSFTFARGHSRDLLFIELPIAIVQLFRFVKIFENRLLWMCHSERAGFVSQPIWFDSYWFLNVAFVGTACIGFLTTSSFHFLFLNFLQLHLTKNAQVWKEILTGVCGKLLAGPCQKT